MGREGEPDLWAHGRWDYSLLDICPACYEKDVDNVVELEFVFVEGDDETFTEMTKSWKTP